MLWNVQGSQINVFSGESWTLHRWTEILSGKHPTEQCSGGGLGPESRRMYFEEFHSNLR